jgi:hypothetical protein
LTRCAENVESIEDLLEDDFEEREPISEKEYSAISTHTRRRLKMKKHKREKRRKLMSSYLANLKKLKKR